MLRSMAFLVMPTGCPDQPHRTVKDKAITQRLTACVQKFQAWQVSSAPILGESCPRNPIYWSRLRPGLIIVSPP